jgi:hypothetical protein
MLFVGVTALWGVLAVVMGLLAALDWPAGAGLSRRLGLACGAALVGAGLYVGAVVSSQLFTGAHRSVTGVLELAPWLGVTAVLIGGLL